MRSTVSFWLTFCVRILWIELMLNFKNECMNFDWNCKIHYHNINLRELKKIVSKICWAYAVLPLCNSTAIAIQVTGCAQFKGIVHPKVKILSSIRWYFIIKEDILINVLFFVYTMEAKMVSLPTILKYLHMFHIKKSVILTEYRIFCLFNSNLKIRTWANCELCQILLWKRNANTCTSTPEQ